MTAGQPVTGRPAWWCARRTQNAPDDTVVKLRPVIPAELPARLRAREEFVVEVDTKGLERSISGVSSIGRQATVGVIVVGQLIGTAIVMAILLQPSLERFQGVAYLAMFAFAVTLIVSFVVLFRLFLEPTGGDEE